MYVPFWEGYTYEQARMFVEALTTDHSPIITVAREKDRVGKFYIDHVQNWRGQTVVAPYAVRSNEGATVSMPIDWNEVNSKLGRAGFTIHTVTRRLEQQGDMF